MNKTQHYIEYPSVTDKQKLLRILYLFKTDEKCKNEK